MIERTPWLPKSTKFADEAPPFPGVALRNRVEAANSRLPAQTMRTYKVFSYLNGRFGGAFLYAA